MTKIREMFRVYVYHYYEIGISDLSQIIDFFHQKIQVFLQRKF